jgi:N-acetylmuramoyl-L-alanine amidase
MAAGAATLIPTSAGQNPPAAQPVPQAPAPATQLSPATAVVVIDAAHGGEDPGARNEAGAAEKEIVLVYARVLRAELQRQGVQAVLTRERDADVSQDARAATANAQRGGIFVSLHIGATGAGGTARTYFFPAPAAGVGEVGRGLRLVPWGRAQEPYAAQSRGLASAVQAQLALKLRGSPATPSAVAVRQLRSVAAPAVAVELANISMERRELDRLAPVVAESIARGIAAFLAAQAGAVK